MRYILIFLKTIAISLALVTAYLKGHDIGYQMGYATAMADVVLELADPEKYFKTLLGLPDDKHSRKN